MGVSTEPFSGWSIASAARFCGDCDVGDTPDPGLGASGASGATVELADDASFVSAGAAVAAAAGGSGIVLGAGMLLLGC